MEQGADAKICARTQASAGRDCGRTSWRQRLRARDGCTPGGDHYSQPLRPGNDGPPRGRFLQVSPIYKNSVFLATP